MWLRVIFYTQAKNLNQLTIALTPLQLVKVYRLTRDKILFLASQECYILFLFCAHKKTLFAAKYNSFLSLTYLVIYYQPELFKWHT